MKKYYNDNKYINVKLENIKLEKDNKLGIKIKQFDMNNNILNEFISINAASRKTSVPRTTISVNLKDKTKSGGGFIWKYF